LTPSELSCEKLHKSFQGLHALRDVSLQFPMQSICAVIGPNGAGKTTLLNILTGFLRADSGRCFIGRRDTTDLAPHTITKLGMARTFQELRLIQQVSVMDNIMLAIPDQCGEQWLSALLYLNTKREEAANRKRALDLLQLVALSEKADTMAGRLSYGQQKLLAIACCLATDAKILLLDEPVAGVDPSMATRILTLLRELQSQGKSIIFVEHDMEAVRQVANIVVVMDAGQVIAKGVTTDVLNKPEIIEAYLS